MATAIIGFHHGYIFRVKTSYSAAPSATAVIALSSAGRTGVADVFYALGHVPYREVSGLGYNQSSRFAGLYSGLLSKL
ncbi:hypothetical protein BH18ACI4_BH18ACI4_13940 [soil metagenome]